MESKKKIAVVFAVALLVVVLVGWKAEAQTTERLRIGWWSQYPLMGGGAHEMMTGMPTIPKVGDYVVDKNNSHRRVNRVMFAGDGLVKLQVGEPQTGYSE